MLEGANNLSFGSIIITFRKVSSSQIKIFIKTKNYIKIILTVKLPVIQNLSLLVVDLKLASCSHFNGRYFFLLFDTRVKRFSSYELDVVSKKSRLESTSAITVDTRWDYSWRFGEKNAFNRGSKWKMSCQVQRAGP